MLVRVSEWSRQLWREVWESRKHDTVTFYEQSALLQRLRAKREGLEMVGEEQPFHSYLPGAPKGVKLFAHVAVLPHLELNTNRCCAVLCCAAPSGLSNPFHNPQCPGSTSELPRHDCMS